MESRVGNVEDAPVKEVTEVKKVKTTTHAVDIVVWSLWAVIMWGFLLALTVIDSPSDSPGIHEFIIISYFLGFSVVFALVYILIIKRG